MKNLGLKIFLLLYIVLSLYIGIVWGIKVLSLISPMFSIILAVLLVIHPNIIITYDGVKAKAIHFRILGLIIIGIIFVSRIF